MKKNLTNLTNLAILVVTQLLLLTSVANAQPYQVTDTQQSVVGGDLIRTQITVQEGNIPLNRFFITSVEKPKPNQTLKGVIILLPPLGSGFRSYEATADGDYNNSFAGYFAHRNWAVVGYSRRDEGIPAGACESGAIDCSPMADWGLQTIVDDVAYIRQYVAGDAFVAALAETGILQYRG